MTQQSGATGTAYPEARRSVARDLLNRLGWDARLEPSSVGEVELATAQLSALQPGAVALGDRGDTGYRFLTALRPTGAHFLARCSRGSFAAAQELFRLDPAAPSRLVTLAAPAEEPAPRRRGGLPLTVTVRVVSVRLSPGELEGRGTFRLEERAYPTEEFPALDQERWGQETFHLMLKSRLDLENWSGRTAEAVRQDFHALVFLGNLESLLTRPAQAPLDAGQAPRQPPAQVNRAVACHALQDQVLALLYGERPAGEVLQRLQQWFLGAPVPPRPGRKVPRRPASLARSYHHQRHVHKSVF